MIAVAWLIAHAVVGATRAIATIEFFIFEEKKRGMNAGTFHLIIYRARREDVVDTLPLALIAISTFNTIITMRILREVIKTVPTDLLEDRAIRTVVEIPSYDESGIWRDGMDGIYRLT